MIFEDVIENQLSIENLVIVTKTKNVKVYSMAKCSNNQGAFCKYPTTKMKNKIINCKRFCGNLDNKIFYK